MTHDRLLTPAEKDDRTQALLSLLDEQDTIRFRVRASRDELREWRVEARNLAARIDQVRSEIRTGVVTESAQPSLPFVGHPDMVDPVTFGIDGSSDEPDPETDPPLPNPYAMFHMNYPKAPNSVNLLLDLQLALTDAEWNLLDYAAVRSWHPSSGQFEAVAHWARVENAHNSAGKRPPTPGLTIPQRFPMPHALAHALAMSPPLPPKAPRKKATTRKAGK